MCIECFEIEYKLFMTEKEWNTFDLLLTKKLSSNKMILVNFERDCKRNKDDGEYIYQCLTCNQRWKLKDPDNAFRGYFLKTK
jgi:hypothetical protein